MNTSKAVVWCAAILVGVALADLAFTRLLGTTQNLAVQLVRLAFTCLLALALAGGRNWARWLSVVLLGIGGAIGLISFAMMFDRYFSLRPIHMLWLLGNGVVFAALALFLSFSRRVAQECSNGIEADFENRPN